MEQYLQLKVRVLEDLSTSALQQFINATITLKIWLKIKWISDPPYLDMLSSFQQPSVQFASLVILLLLNLEVNICLPQHLRHVKLGLVDGQLIYCFSSLRVSKNSLQFCILQQTHNSQFKFYSFWITWHFFHLYKRYACTFIQEVQFSGPNSRNFSYRILHLSNSRNCSSNSM